MLRTGLTQAGAEAPGAEQRLVRRGAGGRLKVEAGAGWQWEGPELGGAGLAVRAPSGGASRTAPQIRYGQDGSGEIPIDLGVSRKIGSHMDVGVGVGLWG